MTEENKYETVFYRLRASELRASMSTADGEDLTEDAQDSGNGWVSAHVYTPSDDPDEDDDNYAAPEARMWRAGELVDMAVFPNTQVDGRLPAAGRTIELLNEYGSAKFGDEWWPSNAAAWIGAEKARELAGLLDPGALAQYDKENGDRA